MKAIVSIKAYDRPSYLHQCLNYLAKCKNIEKYPVLISVDTTCVSMNEQIFHAVSTSGLVNKCSIKLINQTKKLGCAGNFKYCFEESFKDNEDFMIHLEDDILLAEDAILYFEHSLQFLNNHAYGPTLFAACTMHRPVHQQIAPNHEISKLVARRWFEPCGGFAMTRRQYERIQEMGGVFGVNYISEKGRTFDCRGEEWLKEINKDFSLSWAWPFHKYFAENKNSLYPVVSRAINIGRVGLHISADQHRKLHYNENWADNPKYLKCEKFDTNFSIDDSKYIEHGIE